MDSRFSTGRSKWLDSLRVLGILLVVTTHVVTSGWMQAYGFTVGSKVVEGVAWLGVPLLIVVAGYASTLGRGFGTRDAKALGRRMYRLGVPYLAWTGIFFLIQNNLPYGTPVSITLGSLLTGMGVYDVLWYLATLMWVTVLAWTARTQRQRLLGGIGALVVFLGYQLSVQLQGHRPAPAIVYAATLAAWLSMYLLGQCVGSLGAGAPRTRWATAALASAGVLGTALVAGVFIAHTTVQFTPAENVARYVAAGTTALALLVLCRRGQRLVIVPAIAPVTLGIYVLHQPIVGLIGKLVPVGIVPWYVWVPLNVVVVTGVTALASLAMSRTPLKPLFT